MFHFPNIKDCAGFPVMKHLGKLQNELDLEILRFVNYYEIKTNCDRFQSIIFLINDFDIYFLIHLKTFTGL